MTEAAHCVIGLDDMTDGSPTHIYVCHSWPLLGKEEGAIRLQWRKVSEVRP